MKSLGSTLRLVAPIFLLACLFIFSGQLAQAQGLPVASASPGSLSFGVPTGSTTGAQLSLTLNFTGPASDIVDSISIIGTNATDFTQTNTCGPLMSTFVTLPASCTVNVTFTPSPSTSGLETAVLVVKHFVESSLELDVPLSGAKGAIRLFDPLNVNPSLPNTPTWPGQAIASVNVTLSCPAEPGPTGILSSSPDGAGFVFQDNYIRVKNSASDSSPQNVCTGGDSNLGGIGIPGSNCFQPNYEHDVVNYVGQDPDVAVSNGTNTSDETAGTPLLPTFGVAPLDISGLLFSGTQTVTFEMVDAGGELGSSTLHLQTNCTPTNVQTGSETGNPINTANNSGVTQTLTFDSTPNNLDQYNFDYSIATAANTIVPGTENATPIVTNNSIDPLFFSNTLVAGTPFANASCIPSASLNGNCSGKLQVCTKPGNATPSGPNCPDSSSPNIIFSTTFDPRPQDLITDPTTVFGYLEFNDAGGCPLDGLEAGKSCPQNQLVDFSGPGEYTGRRGASSTNSQGVLASGIIPPTTGVLVSPFVLTGPATGWTSSPTPSVTFTGNPAVEAIVPPINFIEYGINPASQGQPPHVPLPFPGSSAFPADPTLPNFSSSSPCPSMFGPSAPPFTPAAVQLSLTSPSNLLHYSTTDCAGTHELNFAFAASKWSTSFKSLTINVDTDLPSASCGSATPVWHANDVSIGCTASDPTSGLASPSPAGPGAPESFSLMTNVPTGTETSNAPTNSQPVCDLAANCVTAGPVSGNMVDKKPPTITITTPSNGASYSSNQVVKASYGCVDGGSGRAPLPAGCNGVGGNLVAVASGSNIDTAPNGAGTTSKTFTVSSVDNVGNHSSTFFSYTVGCHYASVGISPSSVTRPALIFITSSIVDCMAAAQTVSVKYTLSGPLGSHCSNSSTVMFTTPAFTIKSGASNSITFPFPITKAVCAGTYTVTTTTMKNGAAIDSTSATLRVN
jgi:hypothetical protein